MNTTGCVLPFHAITDCDGKLIESFRLMLRQCERISVQDVMSGEQRGLYFSGDEGRHVVIECDYQPELPVVVAMVTGLCEQKSSLE